MAIVHIERTGTHQKDSFILETEDLRTIQNASCEFAGGTQCKAKRVFGPAGRVFEEEPAEVRFYSLCGAAGLSRDKARDIGNIVLREGNQFGVFVNDPSATM